MKLHVLLAILILPPAAFGEYRAFLLQISSPQGQRLVKSTLDPFQYRGYHYLPADHQVTYVDTWMCRGRTGGYQEICPSPRQSPQPPDSASEQQNDE